MKKNCVKTLESLFKKQNKKIKKALELLENVDSKPLKSKICSLIRFHQTIETKSKVSELKRVNYDIMEDQSPAEIKAIANKIIELAKERQNFEIYQKEFEDITNQINDLNKKLSTEFEKTREIDWSRQISKLIKDEYSAQFYKEIRKTFDGITDQNLPKKMKNNKNQMTTNRKEMSEVWASHYQNISSNKNTEEEFDIEFEEAIKTKVKQAMLQETEAKNKFLGNQISPKEIEDVLSNIEAKKSPVYDKISFKIWKTGNKHTIQFLCNWLNFIAKQETVTEELTMGLTISLYKGKKSKNNPANYRPITLLTSVFKILEGVTARIKKILERDHIVHDEQAGYQKNRSTIENLFIIDQCLRISRKTNRKIFVTFMDISKAFDRAWRDGILAKLSEIGIKGKLLRIIKSFYTDTFSIARVNGGFSRKFETTAGVLQESLLSPTLFTLLLNDLVKEVDNTKGFSLFGQNYKILLFADDIALISESQDDMQKMITACQKYGQRWRFKFSFEKTKTITNCEEEIFLKLKDKPLKQTQTYDYLGLPIGLIGERNFYHYKANLRKKYPK